MKQPVTVDFETEAIASRPAYPPRPVGVAIKYPGRRPKYLHWGHPDDFDTFGRGTAQQSALDELQDIWREAHRAHRADSGGLLMHNAKFDLDVAETHLGLKPPPWDRVHDTLFALFLLDPHASDLGLKPSAEKYLGMPPEERDRVRDWLVDHKVIKANENPGPYIARAPASVVGPYACGDVERTLRLHLLLQPKLDAGMRRAYDRERRLLPLMLQNERQGLRVDVDALAADIKIYERALLRVEEVLRKQLRDPGLNFDDDRAVGEALHREGIVTDWVMTKGGNGRAPQRSVAKDNLGPERFNDPSVASRLGYRTRLQTVLANSMRPWLAASQATGYIYTEWNQVRHHERGRGSKGTRTGRISCSRFMNVTKNFLNKGDGYVPPKGLRLPDLPLVRKYVYPDGGHLWNHRDFRQQEFRILAHFEDGDLAESYRKDPDLDYHENVRDVIHGLGNEELAAVDRVIIKNFNFGILYGEGVDLLMVKTKMDRERVTLLKRAVRAATPGVYALNQELMRRGRSNEPVRTWGGRIYYCEPPAVVKKGPHKGQLMSFEYKLLNYLIQGSAADATKEAIIRYHDVRRDSRMLVTVHDEINISAPVRACAREDKLLRDAMESVEFDVPMLTDRKVGPCWGELEKVK